LLEFAPHGATKFTATHNSSYNMQLSSDGRRLGVSGYRVCVVQDLGDIHLYRPIDMNISSNELVRKRVENILAWGDTYFNWKRILQLSSVQVSYPHCTKPMTTREAFMSTFTAYEATATTVPFYRLTESFEAFDVMANSLRKSRLLLRLIPLIFPVHGYSLGAVLLAPYKPLLNKLYSIMSQDPEAQDFCNNTPIALGRRMARADDGHFALVPGNAAVGDEITLLKGACAPIVMRKHTEDDYWEHVGEAYVEGLMTGDGWDESLCEKRWLA